VTNDEISFPGETWGEADKQGVNLGVALVYRSAQRAKSSGESWDERRTIDRPGGEVKKRREMDAQRSEARATSFRPHLSPSDSRVIGLPFLLQPARHERSDSRGR
jgi:hypothetical protein